MYIQSTPIVSTTPIIPWSGPVPWGDPPFRGKRPENLEFLGDESTALFLRFHNFIGTDDLTIVEMDVDFDNGASKTIWKAVGTSRCDPHDKGDAEVGFLLATSRALAAVARDFERQAEGKIKHAEDVARHRAEQQATLNQWIGKTDA